MSQSGTYSSSGGFDPSTATGFLWTLTTPVTDTTGDGTDYTLVMDTKIYDQTSSFDGTTFTAPVAGNYLFSGAVGYANLSDSFSFFIVGFVTPTYNYQIYEMNINVEIASFLSAPFQTAIVKLNAGDQVTFFTSVFGSSKTVSINGGNGTTNAWTTYISGAQV